MPKNKYGTEEFKHIDDTYYCIIHYKDHDFVGSTTIRPADKDFESEWIGYTIAEYRAEIKRLKYCKEVLLIQLKTIERLRSTSHLIVGSNYAKHLEEERFSLNAELILVKQSIEDLKQYLSDYIHNKDRLWKHLRERDKNKQTE